MITVKTLKEHLKSLPDDAIITVYEGEDVGIQITKKNLESPWCTDGWWIRISESHFVEDEYTEGFDEKD